MTTQDLPSGCKVFEFDPRTEAAMLFLGTDDRVHCQRVHDICLDVVVGRESWQAVPTDQWRELFEQRKNRE
jgi:hypothetical protein